MNGEAVKELAARFREPRELASGVVAAPSDWKLYHPNELEKPAAKAPSFAVWTLGALRDYLNSNRDALDMQSLIVHVETPYRVTVSSALRSSRDREVFIQAQTQDLALEFLGKYHTIDDFNVALQTRFCEADQRNDLLRMLSSVKTEQTRGAVDDGVSQTLEAKAVALRSEVPLPNPVRLTAFRTFRDVVQPTSLYVLRAKATQGGLPQVALFEADGGAWQLSTLARIAEWLRENLPKEIAVLA